MQVVTRKYGVLDVEPTQILNFPEGLIGFPECCRFVVLDYDVEGDAVRWLQSVDEAGLGFVTILPHIAFPRYNPQFSGEDLSPLNVETPDDVVVLAVVTVPTDVRHMTANLQAPLVINPKKRVGKQVIVESTEYTTKHSVFAALESLAKRTG